jgi:predicted alpha/beta hydrolase
MTTIIQHQNNFLRSTKQCIVQNMNDIDCLIDIATGSANDIDAATITLREIFYQYKDTMEVNCLMLSRKQTQVGHAGFSSMSAMRRQLTTCSVIWMQHWTPLEHGMIVMSTLYT